MRPIRRQGAHIRDATIRADHQIRDFSAKSSACLYLHMGRRREVIKDAAVLANRTVEALMPRVLASIRHGLANKRTTIGDYAQRIAEMRRVGAVLLPKPGNRIETLRAIAKARTRVPVTGVGLKVAVRAASPPDQLTPFVSGTSTAASTVACRPPHKGRS